MVLLKQRLLMVRNYFSILFKGIEEGGCPLVLLSD